MMSVMRLSLTDNDEVPCNVKQLGTAKISFNDQQRHSPVSQVINDFEFSEGYD